MVCFHARAASAYRLDRRVLFFQLAFEGGMCLHHGPDFELHNFLGFAGGAFPVTLMAIFGTLIVCAKDILNPEP